LDPSRGREKELFSGIDNTYYKDLKKLGLARSRAVCLDQVLG